MKAVDCMRTMITLIDATPLVAIAFTTTGYRILSVGFVNEAEVNCISDASTELDATSDTVACDSSIDNASGANVVTYTTAGAVLDNMMVQEVIVTEPDDEEPARITEN